MQVIFVETIADSFTVMVTRCLYFQLRRVIEVVLELDPLHRGILLLYEFQFILDVQVVGFC